MEVLSAITHPPTNHRGAGLADEPRRLGVDEGPKPPGGDSSGPGEHHADPTAGAVVQHAGGDVGERKRIDRPGMVEGTNRKVSPASSETSIRTLSASPSEKCRNGRYSRPLSASTTGLVKLAGGGVHAVVHGGEEPRRGSSAFPPSVLRVNQISDPPTSLKCVQLT